MKGKLKKIDDKWFVEYSGVSYKGGNPKQLGGYTKKVEKKTLPLHPNFVTMTDYVWVKGIKVYDGDKVKFTESLVNPMGREVDPNDLGQNHSKCVRYAIPYLDKKEEQKQHLIDMMNDDEDLGLYNETFDEYLIRLKDRRTEDNYDYYTDEELELYNDYIMDSWRCGISVYKCLEFMYFAEKEIQPEEIWNEEKMEGIKQLIQDNREETLEEAAERMFPYKMEEYDIFLMGAKWQQEQNQKEIKLLQEEINYLKRNKI